MSVLSENPLHAGPSSRLAIHVSRVHAFTRIGVCGEIDLSTADELRRELLAQRLPGQQILLDLSGVSFIDSSGIRAVLEADAAAGAGDHRLFLTRLSASVRRVLELCGADTTLRASGNWPRVEV